jgi:hypothetical protein
MNGYKEFKPTFAQKFWRALGFELCGQVPTVDKRPGYDPASIRQISTVRFSKADRLRILLSGHIVIVTAIQTDVEVWRAVSTSRVSVMAPGI